jgi:predicted pyridoxine 5'-phosphate oxidase superfamily flavin-nucleotide-binding protein
MTYLSTHEELEAVFGPPKAMVMAKTIDHLDPGARSWIAASAIMIASVAQRDDLEIVIGGGLSGWADGDQTTLRLPVNCLDAADCLVPGSGFGSIFLVPSIRELMRINGRVISNDGNVVSIAVEECYIHCGKALIRSEFWSEVTSEPDLASLAAFAEHCRFLALATSDSHGYADLSPKGDPAGLMVKIEGNTLRFADRPGNKRIDSFRNIVDHPRIAAALIVPGTHKIAVVKGTARITDDLSKRERLAVGDRVPDLVTIVTDIDIELRESAALARACAWPAPAPPAGVSAGRIASGHLKLAKSVGAKLAGAVMSVPGLVDRELARDYKKNLY